MRLKKMELGWPNRRIRPLGWGEGRELIAARCQPKVWTLRLVRATASSWTWLHDIGETQTVQALVLDNRNKTQNLLQSPATSFFFCPQLANTNFIINNTESSSGKWAFNYLKSKPMPLDLYLGSVLNISLFVITGEYINNNTRPMLCIFMLDYNSEKSS